MEIETLVFDFGNVLYSYDYPEFINSVVNSSESTPEEIRNFFFDSGLEDEFNRGDISTQEFYRRMREKFNLEIDKRELILSYANIFKPNEKVINIVEALSNKYRLHLFSDTNPIHYNLAIKKRPIYSFFEAETLSFQIGALKESKEGYKDMVRKANCAPSEILFVDDYSNHIEIAESLGVNGVVFESQDQLESRFVDLGILESSFS